MSLPTTAVQPTYRPGPGKIILWTGLLAGTLDGLSAIINFSIQTGKDPSIVFRFIASGVFGKPALNGGTGMVLWGVLFHYAIAFIFTILFFTLYRRLNLQRINKFLMAVIYGLIVWVCMNLVVVPLSNTPPLVFHLDQAILAAAILIVCIGLPISLMAHAYFSRRS